jgi:hypothetical protein
MLGKSAYDNAKSYGLHFIKDDSTRRLLTQLYEYQVVWSETQDERQTHYYYNSVIPELTNLFEFTSGFSPNNENKLFESKLLKLKGVRSWVRLTLNESLGETQKGPPNNL